MNTPEELRYTKDHEWVRLEGDEAVVGITDFAQGELGEGASESDLIRVALKRAAG